MEPKPCPQSLAVGKSQGCPRCGNQPIGSNGQLWQLLISAGFLGAALYLGFFILALWRSRDLHGGSIGRKFAPGHDLQRA